MSPKPLSSATLFRLLAFMVGLVILAGCGGGSSSSPTPPAGTPAATLSASTLTFSSQAVDTTSAAQPVTVTNSGSATLGFTGFTLSGTNSSDFTISSNTCSSTLGESGTCTLSVTFTPQASGTRTGTVNITDNASNSPQTVTLTGTAVVPTVSVLPSTLAFTSQFLGIQSSSQAVTLTNNTSATITISTITPSADFLAPSNTCGASVAAGGSCTINVTFMPTTAGLLTGTLTITDSGANSPQSVTVTGTGYSNTVAVTAGFGAFGDTGSITSNYYNGLFTTVTVCTPGTTTCVPVTNVLVDTASVGLRILSTPLNGLTLPTIAGDTSGDVLQECYAYGDLTYTWGPVQLATVQIAGETAVQVPGGAANSGVPIQVITAGGTAPSGAACTSSGGVAYTSSNTPALLGANGILGVGNTPQDCGADCAAASSSQELYLVGVCSSNSNCGYASAVPVTQQLWNPVAAFSASPTGSSDSNGLVVTLNSVGAGGAASGAGTLTFGIGTQTCSGSPQGCTTNSITSQTIYELDQNQNFPTTSFNGVPYTSAGFLDTGSNSLFVSDPETLSSVTGTSTIDCADTDDAYYCPSFPLSLTFYNTNAGGIATPLTVSIANADSLFSECTSCQVFSNLGGPSGGTGPSTDYFDFGLPFFFGNTVFIGIQGTSVNNVTSTNGYVAF